MKRIPLYLFDEIISHALVDDKDYKYLMCWKWHPCQGYPYTKENGKSIYMHRKILRRTKAPRIDHENGNKLDNRRRNLRPSTVSQNSINCKLYRTNKTGYRGVSKHSNGRLLRVRLMVNQKEIFIGLFPIDKEKQAAQAYNKAAKKHFGKFARLNIIT